MGYERYPRGDHGHRDSQDHGRDYGSGRDYTYSSARDYAAAGAYDRHRDDDDERDYTRNFVPYGERDYSHEGRGYGERQHRRRSQGQGSYSGRNFDQDRGRAFGDRGQQYGQQSAYGDEAGRGRFMDRGSPAYGRGQGHDDRGGQGRYAYGRHDTGASAGGRGYSGVPQGYDYEERGFFARAGDEVRSWFGDEDAERRREADMSYDDRHYSDRWSQDGDSDYGYWRRSQIAALDRDYDEYRRENRSRFESEFASWRTNRQTQRNYLGSVEEHMEVTGSDGTHVGTVDKVRGDRILLTKTDADAGGRHHSIPSSWIASVDTKVNLAKSADEAKRHWRDEERNLSTFGDEPGGSSESRRQTPTGGFSGTS